MGKVLVKRYLMSVIVMISTLSGMHDQGYPYHVTDENAFKLTPHQNSMFALIDNDTEISPKLSHYKWHFSLYNQTNYACAHIIAPEEVTPLHNLRSDMYELKRSMLHTAMCHRRYDIAQMIINDGVDINNYIDNNKTILHAIAEQQCWTPEVKHEAMLFLCAHGANPNAIDTQNKTPLHAVIDTYNTVQHNSATEKVPNYSRVVQLLKTYGADVNKRDHNGLTPLYLAAESTQDNSSLIRTLIDNACDPNIPDINGHTPIASINRVENARTLVEYGNACTKPNKGYDTTALHRLLQLKRPFIQDGVQYVRIPRDLITTYMQNGAPTNVKNVSRKSALHYARQPDTVHELVGQGENINGKDSSGNTLLHITEDIQVAQACIRCNANINAQNSKGETSLHKTTSKCLPLLCHLLLTNGADLLITDKQGKTVADRLFQHGSLNMEPTTLYTLRAHNAADVNAQDAYGDTPLHTIAKQGSRRKYSMVTLLSEGGDATHENANGKTAYDCANDTSKQHLLSWVQYLNTMEDDTNLPEQLYGQRCMDEVLIMTGQGYINKAITALEEIGDNNYISPQQYMYLAHNLMHSHAQHAETMLKHVRSKYETPERALYVMQDLIAHASPLQETYCHDIVTKYKNYRDKNGNTLLHMLMQHNGLYDNELYRIVPYVASEVIEALAFDPNNPDHIPAYNNNDETPVMIAHRYTKTKSAAALKDWLAGKQALDNTTQKLIRQSSYHRTNNNKRQKIITMEPYHGIPQDILSENVGKFMTGFPYHIFSRSEHTNKNTQIPRNM